MLAKHLFSLHRNVYLDNNATTELSKKVRKVMAKVLKNNFGNPSSLYKKAIHSALILDTSRVEMAKCINAKADEIYFTGSASESNNTIIKALAEKQFPQKTKILSTPIEHASVISTLEYLKNHGFQIEYLPLDEKGRVDLTELEKMVDDSTLLVCCMLANNEIGIIQEVSKISELSHKKGVPVFSDCVQALGKISVDVKSLGVDYASFSAHKIHGPKGCGAMYVKEGAYISPLIHGGHQENGVRAGTECLHNIAGFAEACRQIPESLQKSSAVFEIRNYFIQELKKIKSDRTIVSSEGSDCLPNTVNVVFPGINNAYFIATLDYFNISVSAGSACNTQSNEPSHVLKAIGITDQHARESIRFSMNTSITKTQINYVLKIIRLFITGELPSIGMFDPKLLDEQMLQNPNTYVLDVRFWHDRLLVKGIPNSHEVSFFNYKKHLKKIPRDKNVIIVCQGGYNAPIVAYELKFKGYKHVSFLMLGILAWKEIHPDLYREQGGINIQKL